MKIDFTVLLHLVSFSPSLSSSSPSAGRVTFPPLPSHNHIHNYTLYHHCLLMIIIIHINATIIKIFITLSSYQTKILITTMITKSKFYQIYDENTQSLSITFDKTLTKIQIVKKHLTVKQKCDKNFFYLYH